MNEKKVYKIPVVWQCFGTMYVEAESLKEAERKAIEEEPLPTDWEYVDDSIEIDEESPLYGNVV